MLSDPDGAKGNRKRKDDAREGDDEHPRRRAPERQNATTVGGER